MLSLHIRCGGLDQAIAVRDTIQALEFAGQTPTVQLVDAGVQIHATDLCTVIQRLHSLGYT